jgi:2-polyprenyl-6-methoxyphenol hydroxylase-like FAD-dependent oxidoreductase
MSNLGNNAIVIGRSMGGLAAAAALCPHFEQVLILDKDPAATDRPEARIGVGQGLHLHNLLKGGELSLEQLLPGTTAQLLASGAVPVRAGLDVRIYDCGVWQPLRDLGYDNLAATRPLIEHVVLQQVLRQPRVRVRSQARVDAIDFDAQRRVTGVMLRSTDGAGERLAADLVVDCSGPASRVASAHGYEAPREFKINIGTSYTSAFFELPDATWQGQKGFAILPAPPCKRGSFVGLIEDNRWLVSLHTRLEKELPKSYDEMLAFAREIETPDTLELLTAAKIRSEVRSYRKPAAYWRRYDKLEAFPDGLLVLGDAMTTFNPIFGQGMSVAWLQALALERLLAARSAEGRDLGGLATDYFAAAMRISRDAWNGSTLIDAAYPEVTGDKRPGSDQALVFLRALRTLLEDDPELHADYVAVGQMTKPDTALMTEDRLARIMAAAATL